MLSRPNFELASLPVAYNYSNDVVTHNNIFYLTISWFKWWCTYVHIVCPKRRERIFKRGTENQIYHQMKEILWNNRLRRGKIFDSVFSFFIKFDVRADVWVAFAPFGVSYWIEVKCDQGLVKFWKNFDFFQRHWKENELNKLAERKKKILKNWRTPPKRLQRKRMVD